MKKLIRLFHWYEYALFAIIFTISILVAARMEMIFDESIYLQIPLMLAREGSYSLIYPIDEYNGFIGATLGPTVLLPVGLVFKLFGLGVMRARLLSCFYFTGLLVLFWALTTKSQNRITGLLFLLSIFSIPTIFLYGVSVHGEVPSLFFVVLGTLLWKPNSRNIFPLLCFGLAAVTKTYFLLYALPIVGMIFLENRRAGRSLAGFFPRAILACLIFLMPSLVWELVKFYLIGAERYAGYLASSSSFISGKFSELFTLEMVLERLSTMFEGTFPEMPVYITGLLFLIVFIFYTVQLVVNRELGPAQSLFLGLVTFTAWYLFLSGYGWWRFFFPFALVFMYLLFNLLHIAWYRLSQSALAWRTFSASVFLIVFSIFVIRPAIERLPLVLDGTRLESQRAVAEKVLSYQNLGYRFGVWGWWQAPEISFLAGGMGFTDVQVQCKTSFKRNYLILHTKTHERLEPETAAKLLDCAGELIYSSPDGGYFLYEPIRKKN